MSGRRPFSELTKDFTPEQQRRIGALRDEMKTAIAVLLKFKDAFPDLYTEKKVDHTFAFKSCGYKGATLHIRRARPDIARIHAEYVKNYPNAEKLKVYLTKNKVRTDSRPDYLIGPEHVDAVIAILKEGLARGTTA